MIELADGSYDGSLPDYYYGGCAVDIDTNDVYLSSYYSNDVVYYDGASWNVYDSPGDKKMGVAVGWDKIFVLRTTPYREILVYDLATRTLEETITLNNWGGEDNFQGITTARENVVGDNESVFIACYYGISKIIEVEVGNYISGSNIKASSLGGIKASFH